MTLSRTKRKIGGNGGSMGVNRETGECMGTGEGVGDGGTRLERGK